MTNLLNINPHSRSTKSVHTCSYSNLSRKTTIECILNDRNCAKQLLCKKITKIEAPRVRQVIYCMQLECKIKERDSVTEYN